MNNKLKQKVLGAAVLGAAIGLLLPSRKDKENPYIEMDLDQAKKTIDSIKSACEEKTQKLLAGEIDREIFLDEIDGTIRELSEGLLQDSDDYKAYVEYYNNQLISRG